MPTSQAAEIWIIEDEITSGTTVKNLISQIQDYLSAPIFRIFSFADSRSPAQKENFFKQFRNTGRIYLFHALASATELCASASEFCQPQGNLADYPAQLVQQIADQLQKTHLLEEPSGEHLFVIGEAVSTAVLLVAAGVFSSFQHITLSPWSIDCINITSRIQFANYYLYNYQDISSSVHLIHNPDDHAVGAQVKQHFEELKIPVELFL